MRVKTFDNGKIAVRRALRRFAGQCLCDRCVLAEATRDLPTVSSGAIVRMLGEVAIRADREFSRYHGKCDRCRTAGLVTIASRRLVWA